MLSCWTCRPRGDACGPPCGPLPRCWRVMYGNVGKPGRETGSFHPEERTNTSDGRQKLELHVTINSLLHYNQ